MLRLHVLDDRQYRSPQACSPPGSAGSRIVGAECAQRFDPARTMLGAPQEAWFDASMRGSHARWNVVAQQTLIGPAATVRGTERRWWTDGWDGYPFARRRLLQAVRGSAASNPIALGGDVHTFYAGELHEDVDRPGPRPVMVELVGGSITSRSWPQAIVEQVVAANPNLRWGDSRYRGYGRLDLAPGAATVALRVVADAADPNSPIRTLRTFAIRDGEGRLEG
jgi:alkaline phosphatase D